MHGQVAWPLMQRLVEVLQLVLNMVVAWQGTYDILGCHSAALLWSGDHTLSPVAAGLMSIVGGALCGMQLCYCGWGEEQVA